MKSVLVRLAEILEQKDPRKIYSHPITDEIAPNYSKIIKRPICLNDIKCFIHCSQYGGLDEFAKDVFLMYGNAMVYNAPNTIFFQKARKLMQAFARLIYPKNFEKMILQDFSFQTWELEALKAGMLSREQVDLMIAETENRVDRESVHKQRASRRNDDLSPKSFFLNSKRRRLEAVFSPSGTSSNDSMLSVGESNRFPDPSEGCQTYNRKRPPLRQASQAAKMSKDLNPFPVLFSKSKKPRSSTLNILKSVKPSVKHKTNNQGSSESVDSTKVFDDNSGCCPIGLDASALAEVQVTETLELRNDSIPLLKEETVESEQKEDIKLILRHSTDLETNTDSYSIVPLRSPLETSPRTSVLEITKEVSDENNIEDSSVLRPIYDDISDVEPAYIPEEVDITLEMEHDTSDLSEPMDTNVKAAEKARDRLSRLKPSLKVMLLKVTEKEKAVSTKSQTENEVTADPLTSKSSDAFSWMGPCPEYEQVILSDQLEPIPEHTDQYNRLLQKLHELQPHSKQDFMRNLQRDPLNLFSTCELKKLLTVYESPLGLEFVYSLLKFVKNCPTNSYIREFIRSQLDEVTKGNHSHVEDLLLHHC